MSLSEKLKRLRASAGLSFQLLSERSGVDVKYLHDLETGRKARPSRDILIRLGFGLNLDLSDVDLLLLTAGHPTLTPPHHAALPPLRPAPTSATVDP